MPWKVCKPMDERLKFIARLLDGEKMAVACRDFGISRRPLVVVAVDEVVELGLLLQEVAAGRFGGLQLQGQMHALVAAVLLRATWLDALDLDSEPEPPDREL